MQNEDWNIQKEPTQQNQEPLKLDAEQEKAIAYIDKTLDLDNTPLNGVLIVKISSEDHLYANELQMGIIRRVLDPRIEKLKERHLTVLFMAKDDDVSLLSEADMLAAGWIKKDKSRIILP
jgi:hypothetical protein